MKILCELYHSDFYIEILFIYHFSRVFLCDYIALYFMCICVYICSELDIKL